MSTFASPGRSFCILHHSIATSCFLFGASGMSIYCAPNSSQGLCDPLDDPARYKTLSRCLCRPILAEGQDLKDNIHWTVTQVMRESYQECFLGMLSFRPSLVILTEPLYLVEQHGLSSHLWQMHELMTLFRDCIFHFRVVWPNLCKTCFWFSNPSSSASSHFMFAVAATTMWAHWIVYLDQSRPRPSIYAFSYLFLFSCMTFSL